MRTLQGYSLPPIRTIPSPLSSPAQVLSLSSGGFLSHGGANCNPRLPFLPWKPSTSLSQALRVLLPLRIILEEVSNHLHLGKHDPHSIIKSTIFEDNQACFLPLATYDPPTKLTPRSKSIAVKYLWFREHLEPGVIEIRAIASVIAGALSQPAAKAAPRLVGRSFTHRASGIHLSSQKAGGVWKYKAHVISRLRHKRYSVGFVPSMFSPFHSYFQTDF